MNTIRTLPLLLLSLGLAAQSVTTFPSDHATVANGTGSQNWFPYSYGVSRMMAVYEAWDIGVPAGNNITRIGFRAEGSLLSYGESLQLEVRMGQTEKTAATMVNNYDDNYFGAPQTVFGPGLFVMPDMNNLLNPNPDGAIIWLNLTTPYTFDPSQNLLVEWRVYANTNGGASFPYRLDRAAFISPIVTGPIGCQHSGGGIPDLGSRPTKIGSNWYLDLYTAPASQPIILFINVGSTLTPQFPLAALFPGIDPACQGQISPVALFSLGAMTSAQGFKTFAIPIPNDLAFNDFVLSSQVFCFDFFSPGGLVVSNGDQIELGVDPRMSILWSQNGALAATGFVYRNWGVVTLFEHN